MENPKKRKALSVLDKIDIINEIESGKSNVDVCRNYGLSKSTVSTIWRNREAITEAFKNNKTTTKKMRLCNYPDLDEALFEWFKVQRSMNARINGDVLERKAEKLAKEMGYNDFKCNYSWIARFRARHDITFGIISGEAGSVNQSDVKDWLDNVWSRTKNQYKPEDIFNIDETGLFYHMMPDKTFRMKGETCVGGKLSKERVTVLIGANMSGTEKAKLLVIGKSKKPRCFKNIKKLPTNYESNKKAWMTSQLFTKIMREWDKELRKKKRHILVLIDNCPAHCHIDNLTNIKLMFFPPNVTSVLQPMDQGVIRSFKCFYRKKLIIKYVDLLDRGGEQEKISLLEAMRYMVEAWDSVTEKTIKNCFKKSGLLAAEQNEDLEIDCSLSNWVEQNGLAVNLSNLDDYVTIDDQLVVSEIPTDADILQSIKKSDNDSSDEDDDHGDQEEVSTNNYTSSTTALSALAALSSFYETNDNVGDEFYHYYCKMKNMLDEFHLKNRKAKQSSIMNFFKKL